MSAEETGAHHQPGARVRAAGAAERDAEGAGSRPRGATETVGRNVAVTPWRVRRKWRQIGGQGQE